MKLRNKLFISFVFVVFIPVIIVGGYLTNELRKYALDDAIKQASTNMQRVQDRTLEVLKVPIYLSNNIQFDPHLKKIVNHHYHTTFDVFTAYNDFNTFKNYHRLYSNEIASIRFYTDNQTLLNNWEIIPITREVKHSSWYIDAYRKRGYINWLYFGDETNNQQKDLHLVRKIEFFDTNTNGVLVIRVNTRTLNTILSQEATPTMIVDHQNNIIASNQEKYRGMRLNQIVNSSSILNGKTGIISSTSKEVASHVFIEKIPLEDSANHLRIVSFIEDSYINKNAHHFRNVGIIVIILSVFVALVLIYYLSKLLSGRLIRLSERVSEVGKGNFDIPIPIDGDDEIGQLSKQLSLMVENTKHLLRQVETSNKRQALLERKQNEIKFKMMASQINPHFLFNALESVRMQAHINGDKEVAQVVKILGKFMRNSIEVGTGHVPLQIEMEVVRWYLEIQKFRYGDRISYEIDMDPSFRDIQIPSLIIQPLVENAVIHGLENNKGSGTVWVHTRKADEVLLVEVSDNGIGMSEEKRKEILKVLASQDESEEYRIGLRNVHQRLLLLYGESSGLNIDSKRGSGTKVSFSIPI